MKKLFALLIILEVYACNPSTDEQTPEDTQQVIDTTVSTETQKEAVKLPLAEANFLTFYQKFITAIDSKNQSEINEFIDETFGLYFIESNGAMPMFKRVNDIAKFKSVRGKLFFELPLSELGKLPTFEELPKIICDTAAYDKLGCFAQKTNPFANDEFWYFSDLNEKEKQAISAFAEKIDFTVINTSVGKFYFTKSEDVWKLGFIDLRVPCES